MLSEAANILVMVILELAQRVLRVHLKVVILLCLVLDIFGLTYENLIKISKPFIFGYDRLLQLEDLGLEVIDDLVSFLKQF